ncbi:immune inhibitor A domain-containing protein [Geobacillus sp. JS12]|uniref:immune inhibitor A domain-containing protein n=1 Tax=Geobacillus sp. JS12 TaxID=1813182 RepID=UPI00078D3CE1|nr:immune inhibitor A domain-containing protein [Geobacillus sp. JS12]AMQ20624.1 hypothetical protein A0V43_06480 [Geobacillus sp. JS12]
MQDGQQTNGVLNGKGKKLGQLKTASVPSVKPEPWNGGKRVDRVLVLLIEYPDFPHNNIQPTETDMTADGAAVLADGAEGTAPL